MGSDAVQKRFSKRNDWHIFSHILLKKGKQMLFSELKCKDVINIRDCKKLGRVTDLEFDECSGCICKIKVPACQSVLSFLNCEPDIVIPYKDIKQIGPDIILVDIRC